MRRYVAAIAFAVYLVASQTEVRGQRGAGDSGYDSAEAWCLKKHDQTAAVYVPPGRRPSREEAERLYAEIERGRNAFMRECMKNQGYSYDPDRRRSR